MPSSTKPTCQNILAQLKKLGKESHRRTFIRHGAPEDCLFGVPIGDLKPIQKRIGKDYELSKELFATGNADAQYLAGLIADETRMTKRDLDAWLRGAAWSMISGCTVPWVASESAHAVPLATKWIEAKQEEVAAAGWATLSSYLGVTPDDALELPLFERLLDRVAAEVHGERNGVKDAMNSFVMAAGCFSLPLHKRALAVAKKIGPVAVDHGDTSCTTHVAEDYIRKVEEMGRVGRKRKSARC
jgi:3-methyladenine DNA glycosylase AlkD